MADIKTLFINNQEIQIGEEKTVLELARRAGIEIPTFCYRPDLTQYGACRLCVVEVEGRGIQASCTMPPRAGMKVFTNTQKVRKIRKAILELLLAQHNRDCTLCTKSGNCELQKYSAEYGITEIPYKKKKEDEFLPVDNSSVSVVRDPNKCILCGACVRACMEFQGIGVLAFSDRGSSTKVQPVAGKHLADVNCVNCGQCVSVCPTGALTVKSDINFAFDKILDTNVKTVLQIAPSVRVALGEMFGQKSGENSIKKIYTAARKLGIDLVFDTNFSADLTIMEEGAEFLQRLKSGENLPIFTSCCPAWVRYLEINHPDMLNHLSTAKSPQGMLSSIAKEFAPKYYEGFTKENICVISIMPCTAKKYEAKRQELSGQTDIVLTTYEFAKMIKNAGIDFETLEDSEADSPFGKYTGGGTIFGASGGVAEAAARSAYNMATGKNLENLDITPLRGVDCRSKEASLEIEGKKIKIRVVSTLKEAEKAVREVKEGRADFQMLEVMACPGGCVNGGGQPSACQKLSIKRNRAMGLYEEDRNLPLRNCHENPEIIKLYKEFLDKPASHKAHELLHTTYSDKSKTVGFVSV
ncbi:MAG: [FeFe] hydrogenase, group A [Candidatus Gastranaerophilales bacterium]|nr:[FeFe] hydrogenase, group A [Candidatus Gastranaerophilales bacterium]